MIMHTLIPADDNINLIVYLVYLNLHWVYSWLIKTLSTSADIATSHRPTGWSTPWSSIYFHLVSYRIKLTGTPWNRLIKPALELSKSPKPSCERWISRQQHPENGFTPTHPIALLRSNTLRDRDDNVGPNHQSVWWIHQLGLDMTKSFHHESISRPNSHVGSI